MPELPEVETIRRELEPAVVGRTLGEAWAFPHPKFTPALPASGGTVVRLSRRGKFLLFGVSGLDDLMVRADPKTPGEGARPEPIVPSGTEGTDGRIRRELIVHLGMTGSLQVRRSPVALDDPYVRAWWELAPGFQREVQSSGPSSAAGGPGWGQPNYLGEPSGQEWLVFRDVRRFGRIQFTENEEYVGTLATQGPDALDPDLTADDVWRAVSASSRALKTQLLSQRPLAGVGNIYADEALWLARIHPRSRRLSRARAGELLDALRQVLVESIDNGGTTLRDYRTANGAMGRNQGRLACYGREGEPCLRCGTTLRRIVLDARSTTYCPSCQH